MYISHVNISRRGLLERARAGIAQGLIGTSLLSPALPLLHLYKFSWDLSWELEIIMDIDVDSIIQRLLEVRGSRPGRNVYLQEGEIRGLCMKAREIFISQPILLELEAPIKICGM